MVDSKVLPRPAGYSRGRPGFRGSYHGRGGRGGRGGDRAGDRDGGRRQGRGGTRAPMRGGSRGPYRSRWEDRRNVQRESSVEVGPDWELLEEIPAVVLSKMPMLGEVKGSDITTCGDLPYLDRTLDRITVKTPKRLAISDAEYPRVTTTDDAIIRRTASPLLNETVFRTPPTVKITVGGDCSTVLQLVLSETEMRHQIF